MQWNLDAYHRVPMARLFISQERLDAWTVESRVRLESDVMTLADDGRSFRIVPAVRFLSVAGDAADPNNLLNTVQDEAALAQMGADQYMNSVIVGETAYDVQAGFLGEPLPRGGA